MRRFRLWGLAAGLLAAAGVVIAIGVGGVAAASPTSIVGSWSGQLKPLGTSRAPRRHFSFVVYRGERNGRWRAGPQCAGTLRLKDISNGYHHYYRVAGKNPGCAAPGVDCLKRAGAQMVDVFVSNSGTKNTTGDFRRVS
jgi:hypothetical protein